MPTRERVPLKMSSPESADEFFDPRYDDAPELKKSMSKDFLLGPSPAARDLSPHHSNFLHGASIGSSAGAPSPGGLEEHHGSMGSATSTTAGTTDNNYRPMRMNSPDRQIVRRASKAFWTDVPEPEDNVYRKDPRYMLYAVVVLMTGVILLSADQNLAAPHMSDIAADFFTADCEQDARKADPAFLGADGETILNTPVGLTESQKDKFNAAVEKCVDDQKLTRLGGVAQMGFFLLGGAATLFIGPLADVWQRVRLLVIVIWCGSVPCLLTLLIPNGEFGFWCYMSQRVMTGISVGRGPRFVVLNSTITKTQQVCSFITFLLM